MRLDMVILQSGRHGMMEVRSYIQQSTDVESVPATSMNVIDFDFDYSAQEAIQSSSTKTGKSCPNWFGQW